MPLTEQPVASKYLLMAVQREAPAAFRDGCPSRISPIPPTSRGVAVAATSRSAAFASRARPPHVRSPPTPDAVPERRRALPLPIDLSRGLPRGQFEVDVAEQPMRLLPRHAERLGGVV